MPNQRDIAQVLGVSQVAVSLALRGDPSISSELRTKVRQTAKRLGYRPNPYVSTLMTHIRAGRKPSEQGVIALLVDVYQRDEWLRHESYRVYYDGVVRRAGELGFHIELFFLREPGASAAKIDRILYARGVRGLILAPPYLGDRSVAMNWSRYACVGTGYGWEQQRLDRVAHDHDQNIVLAMQKLGALGYARVGFCIPTFYARGRGTRWMDGLFLCQHRMPAARRVPPFIGSVAESSFPAFKKWRTKWSPDVLLTLYGARMAGNAGATHPTRHRTGGGHPSAQL
jgi:LacI family transcriptional regulator